MCIKNTLRTTVNRTWSYIQDTTEFWTQYLKSQTVETANGIWTDTKPEIQEFLNDIRCDNIYYQNYYIDIPSCIIC